MCLLESRKGAQRANDGEERGQMDDLLVKIGGRCSRRSMLRHAYPKLGIGRGLGVQRRAVSSISLPGISAAVYLASYAQDKCNEAPLTCRGCLSFFMNIVLAIVSAAG